MIRDQQKRETFVGEAHAEPGRQQWEKPSVQRLRAGSAEDGGGGDPDGTNQS